MPDPLAQDPLPVGPNLTPLGPGADPLNAEPPTDILPLPDGTRRAEPGSPAPNALGDDAAIPVQPGSQRIIELQPRGGTEIHSEPVDADVDTTLDGTSTRSEWKRSAEPVDADIDTTLDGTSTRSEWKRSPDPQYGRKRSPEPQYGRKRSPEPQYGRKRSPEPQYGRKRSPEPQYGRN